jgi:hypothetical protein
MINEEMINERKETLLSDIEIVKMRLIEIEKKRLEDQALINALNGAVQQCNDFLKVIHDEESDVGDGN